MKSVHFRDSKLKFVKALLFLSFHETEAPIAFYCFTFICGRAYLPGRNALVTQKYMLPRVESSSVFSIVKICVDESRMFS